MKKFLLIFGGLVAVIALGYLAHVIILKSKIDEYVAVNLLIIESYEKGDIDTLNEALSDASNLLERKSIKRYLGETEYNNTKEFYSLMHEVITDAEAMTRGGTSLEFSLMAGDKYKSFVKTNAKCGRGNCRCSGYWGIKHYNGTYEGACRNSDGYGHTCGHSPQDHGLRKW
ncbi:MAG: hypothetical protein IKV91_00320 [Bacteroidales bacterium]|nr:hypothetical protein [Bacteroidales bacterium]